MKTIEIPELVAKALKLGKSGKVDRNNIIAKSILKAAEEGTGQPPVEGDTNKFGKKDFPKSKGNDFKTLIGAAVTFCKSADENKYASLEDIEAYCHKFLESQGYMYIGENVTALAEAVAKKFKSTDLFILK